LIRPARSNPLPDLARFDMHAVRVLTVAFAAVQADLLARAAIG
jgi:hypothetical protein